MAEASLRWVRCRLVAGHGMASGRAPTSPYPAGTIHLQAPIFAARGIDLSPFFAGTLNLEAVRDHWRLSDPDARVEALEWTDRHPPETFSFWQCRLRVPAETATAAIVGGGAGGEVSSGDAVCSDAGGAVGSAGLAALIYYPHPETKRAHHQAPSCLEVLSPWIPGLTPGLELELGVDPRCCRLIDPVRLRARLLEFHKFRVLAAQEEFFVALRALQPGDAPRPDPRPCLAPAPQVVGRALVQPTASTALGATAALDPNRFRTWLQPLWPEALDLDDADLLATLEQARQLHVN